jgi:hypothetical protein
MRLAFAAKRLSQDAVKEVPSVNSITISSSVPVSDPISAFQSLGYPEAPCDFC